MLISVIVPTYNRADSLTGAIQALLAQTYPSFEIIVVDDGSTDRTVNVARRHNRVQYLRQNHCGPAAARNAGGHEAQGEIIAFTDDDCMPPADWLSRIAQGYVDYPEVAAIGGPCRAPDAIVQANAYARYEWTYERGMLPPAAYVAWLTQGQLDWRAQWPSQGDYLGGMDCPTGRTNNMSVRRDVFQKLNGFDASFPLAAAEDADFKIRLCLAGHRLLWLDALIVEHHHPYTFRRFCRQHVGYGRGVVHLERKYRGQATPRWRAAARLVRRMVRLPIARSTDPRGELARLRFIADVCDAWGQIVR
jgi:glycosyltransferase involved in cell wall biosynthesis